jgi:uncharacterized protein (DUF885 family)
LLRSEMKALARRIAEHRGWQARDLVSVIRALKQEQIPEDALLALYRERLGKIEEIIRRESLLTLPQRKAAIRLATEAEAAASPASFMTPPQLINNTGRMSRDEAERFLVEQLALSQAMASSEADRYAFWLPGQATSYYVGYMNMMRLRTEVEIAAGDSFDQRAFHDFILEQGLLPPQLLRAAVLQRFVH